jgi:hypothetical protein
MLPDYYRDILFLAKPQPELPTANGRQWTRIVAALKVGFGTTFKRIYHGSSGFWPKETKEDEREGKGGSGLRTGFFVLFRFFRQNRPARTTPSARKELEGMQFFRPR